MSARLQALLIGERVLPEETVRAAAARQLVYGGGLDTALLEMGVITEAAIWARLAAATGLPVPAPAWCDGTRVGPEPVLTADRTADLRAVPVDEAARTMTLMCAEPIADDDIRRVVAAHGFAARLYVVPEVRLLALRQRIYGEPLPQRYARLLARALGAERARKSFARPRLPPSLPALDPSTFPAGPAAPRAPGAPVAGAEAASDPLAPTPLGQVLELSGPLLAGDASLDVDIELEGAQPMSAIDDEPLHVPARLALVSEIRIPVDDDPQWSVPGLVPGESAADSATEALCRRARDPHDKGRRLALRALRRRATQAPFKALVAELRALAATQNNDAIFAIDSLSELRDAGAVPILIDQLDLADPPPFLQEAALRALVVLTAQDFGDVPRRWQTWWRENAERQRVEWLLDGLAHKQLELRELAFEELRPLSGETFGYRPDLPKRKRDLARRRWAAWWKQAAPEPPPLAATPTAPQETR